MDQIISINCNHFVELQILAYKCGKINKVKVITLSNRITIIIMNKHHNTTNLKIMTIIMMKATIILDQIEKEPIVINLKATQITKVQIEIRTIKSLMRKPNK
mgnify:CR=1 FL=1